MATVTGSVMSAFRPYLSDRFPTMGVTTSAPIPVTCIGAYVESAGVSWTLACMSTQLLVVARRDH
jgi:hypothetical protein